MWSRYENQIKIIFCQNYRNTLTVLEIIKVLNVKIWAKHIFRSLKMDEN
jgi:hypothetical protein